MISFGAVEGEPPPLHTFSQSGDGRGRRGNCRHLLNGSDHAIVAAVRLIGSCCSADEYAGPITLVTVTHLLCMRRSQVVRLSSHGAMDHS